MSLVVADDLQDFKLFPKSKQQRDRYLNIKKGVCPLAWAMGLGMGKRMNEL